jgi:hypothetical protein
MNQSLKRLKKLYAKYEIALLKDDKELASKIWQEIVKENYIFNPRKA